MNKKPIMTQGGGKWYIGTLMWLDGYMVLQSKFHEDSDQNALRFEYIGPSQSSFSYLYDVFK